MALFQHIVAYLVLALAVGFLIRKYLIPRSRKASGKKHAKDCGNDNCGCH